MSRTEIANARVAMRSVLFSSAEYLAIEDLASISFVGGVIAEGNCTWKAEFDRAQR